MRVEVQRKESNGTDADVVLPAKMVGTHANRFETTSVVIALAAVSGAARGVSRISSE